MKTRAMLRHALTLCLAALIAACASQSGRVERSPDAQVPADAPLLPLSQPPAPPITTPPPATLPPARSYPRGLADSGASPAAVMLVKQAQDARGGGHPEQAQSLLERALRIEPRNAFVWQAMAQTQADLKAWDQVEGAARKSNSFARGNPYAEVVNWKLIAAARSAQGDPSGAFGAQGQADAAAARIAAP